MARGSDSLLQHFRSYTMKTPAKRGSISRRAFVRTVAASATVAPLIIPSRLLGGDAPGNRVRVAHIGCGRIARGHDMPGVANSGLADVVAVCDLDSRRVKSAKTALERLYRNQSGARPEIAMHGDYHELLARQD